MAWLFGIPFVLDCLAVLLGIFTLFSDKLSFGEYSKSGGLGVALVLFCLWLGGSFYLFRHGHKVLATVLAWIPAVPLLLYGLFVLLFVLLKPDMK